MSLVAAWELIVLDEREGGGQRATVVADCADGKTRLVTFDLNLTEAQADALRLAGGPLRRSTP